MRSSVFLALWGLAGCKGPVAPEPEEAYHFELDGQLNAEVHDVVEGENGRLWIALGNDFAFREPDGSGFIAMPRGDLPSGHVTFLGHIDGSREWIFAHVNGKGFYRTFANSGVWEPVLGLTSTALDIVRPGARPIPRAMTPGTDVTWLATVGGLFFTQDEGANWELADTASSGNSNIVFTDVAARGDFVAAVALQPTSLLPPQFAGALTGRVFFSRTSGLTFDDADGDFPSDYPTSVDLADDGTLYVGTMDYGLVRLDPDGWTPLFGPTDVNDIEWVDGGLSVSSATRGLWRFEDDQWSQVAPERPGVGVEGQFGIARGGDVYTLERGRREDAEPQANGTVHIALSFHGNFYHSYRGDTNDDDGFGQDIRVIRNTLEWLDKHEEVHADWDFDNAFTTDDWMETYAPDIKEAIRSRVSDGQDDVRLMSWNNGAMASSNDAEFTESIQRAKESNEDAFGEWVPGVQPQENMLSPDDLRRYTDAGLEWVTLFYSANGFTGPRNDIRLDGAAAYNPFELGDTTTGGAMRAVPVYHHGDLLDHGGLRGWATQLNAAYDEDTLLVIHFDADAESWDAFDRELESIEDLPFIEYTTIQTYLSSHDQRADVDLPGDVADGVGDGFSSWAEKGINHEIWTQVERARRLEAAAAFIGESDTATQMALPFGMEPRLKALSTTNFGLAAPRLHPDREVSATTFAGEALEAAQTVLAIAEQSDPVPYFELQVVNPRDASGPVPLQFELAIPAGVWEGEEGLVVERSGGPLPIRAQQVRFDPAQNADIIGVTAMMDTPALTSVRLTWSYDPADETHATGNLTAADVPVLPRLRPPMSECLGENAVASGGQIGSEVGPWGLFASRHELWLLPTCSGTTTVTRTLTKLHEYPGLILDVDANIADPDDADALLSLALSPLVCDDGIADITWPSFAGTVRDRTVPSYFEAWNPVSADGWVGITCNDGSRIQVAADTTVRSSMGMVSLRNEGGQGLIAPLGTLWGDSPWHDSARTGGTGMSDLVTPLLGSQFRPSAPDWAGRSVRYRLWITADVDPELLELFAHPPYVRSPALP